MRLFFSTLAVALASLAGLSPLQAQPWVGPAPVYDNYSRAYRHFLTSPYSYRTFSSLSPGYAGGAYTPFGYQSFYATPGYVHQRITPWGFEAYGVVPERGNYFLTPLGAGYSYAPGYTYDYASPTLPPPSPTRAPSSPPVQTRVMPPAE